MEGPPSSRSKSRDLSTLSRRARQPPRGGGRHGELGGAAARRIVVPVSLSACLTAREGGESPPMPRAGAQEPPPTLARSTLLPPGPHVGGHRLWSAHIGGPIAVAAASVAVVLGIVSGAGRRQGVEPPGCIARGDGGPARTGPPPRRAGLDHLGERAGQGRRPALGAGLPRLVDAPPPWTKAGPTSCGPSRGTSPSPSACWVIHRARPASPWPGPPVPRT